MSNLALLLECGKCGQREMVEDDDTREGLPIRDWFLAGGRLCAECRNPASPPVTIPQVRQMARATDPPSALHAAALAQPKVGTRKAKVLARLRFADGDWVAGEDIANPAVGGSEGLKRLRELRADGWPIEEKAPPDGEGMWWYRLAEVPAREQGSYHRPPGR